MVGKPLALGLCTAVCLVAAVPATAQEPVATTDPALVALEGRVSRFLEGVSMGQTQTAYQELLAGSQLLKQDEALKVLTEKTNELETKYGRYRAFERIDAKRVGADLVLMKYLYKCEDFPVVWYFTFYRTPSTADAPAEGNPWRLITVRFDTELELLAF
jgi:hypothetical protein